MIKNGSGVLTPHKETSSGLKSQPRKNNNGSGASAPHKEKSEAVSAGLKSQPPRDDNVDGTKVPLPKRHSHLPHIDLEGYYQFVTFRTFDSVDEFVRKWGFNPAMKNKETQLGIDEYLDTSTNGAYLQDNVLGYLYDFLIAHDKKLYELSAFCIMNNHVHILFKPLERLSKVMQMLKGASAKKINELLGKNGKFWDDDYYDKAIRDEKHFFVVYEYIRNNPLKIGGTKVPLPGVGGAEATLPRFYGIFE
ncbi:MAG: transposase [Sulfurimonas sp.]|jgi:REP element-mobilizing transposase RayT